MFDKFIESGTEADQSSRRSYFLVSTIAVGILFVTGVIASIYAQDIALGTDEFDLTSITAPVPPDVREPEPPRPQNEQQEQETESDLPTRQAAIDRVADSTKIPVITSVVPNTQREMPYGRFKIDNYDSVGLRTSNPTVPAGPDGPIGTSARSIEPEPERDQPEAPPVIKKVPPVISKGPMNGYATSLPKPIYPAAARAIGVVGNVSIQVLIDEKGNVISAKVIDGHPFLRLEAERAAWKAKFKPTTLSDVPVKVTGVITYRFTK